MEAAAEAGTHGRTDMAGWADAEPAYRRDWLLSLQPTEKLAPRLPLSFQWHAVLSHMTLLSHLSLQLCQEVVLSDSFGLRLCLHGSSS